MTGHGVRRYAIYISIGLNWRVLTSGCKDVISENMGSAAQGTSFVPIILGSDKTTVSVATGQNEYYPLYLSIGNVRNGVRRAHRNAVAVIAFLAIPKSKCASNPLQHSIHLSHFVISNTRSREQFGVQEVPTTALPHFSLTHT